MGWLCALSLCLRNLATVAYCIDVWICLYLSRLGCNWCNCKKLQPNRASLAMQAPRNQAWANGGSLAGTAFCDFGLASPTIVGGLPPQRLTEQGRVKTEVIAGEGPRKDELEMNRAPPCLGKQPRLQISTVPWQHSFSYQGVRGTIMLGWLADCIISFRTL